MKISYIFIICPRIFIGRHPNTMRSARMPSTKNLNVYHLHCNKVGLPLKYRLFSFDRFLCRIFYAISIVSKPSIPMPIRLLVNLTVSLTVVPSSPIFPQFQFWLLDGSYYYYLTFFPTWFKPLFSFLLLYCRDCFSRWSSSAFGRWKNADWVIEWWTSTSEDESVKFWSEPTFEVSSAAQVKVESIFVRWWVSSSQLACRWQQMVTSFSAFKQVKFSQISILNSSLSSYFVCSTHFWLYFGISSSFVTKNELMVEIGGNVLNVQTRKMDSGHTF